jgi:hypothetical protein
MLIKSVLFKRIKKKKGREKREERGERKEKKKEEKKGKGRGKRKLREEGFVHNSCYQIFYIRIQDEIKLYHFLFYFFLTLLLFPQKNFLKKI